MASECLQRFVVEQQDAFPVVASLFGGREATTGNASAVRRLDVAWNGNPIKQAVRLIAV